MAPIACCPELITRELLEYKLNTLLERNDPLPHTFSVNGTKIQTTLADATGGAAGTTATRYVTEVDRGWTEGGPK